MSPIFKLTAFPLVVVLIVMILLCFGGCTYAPGTIFSMSDEWCEAHPRANSWQCSKPAPPFPPAVYQYRPAPECSRAEYLEKACK